MLTAAIPHFSGCSAGASSSSSAAASCAAVRSSHDADAGAIAACGGWDCVGLWASVRVDGWVRVALMRLPACKQGRKVQPVGGVLLHVRV